MGVGAERANRCENATWGVEQRIGLGHGVRGAGAAKTRDAIAVVFDDEVDLAAVDATFGVHVLEYRVRGLGHVGVSSRSNAGQWNRRTDGDLVVRDAVRA